MNLTTQFVDKTAIAISSLCVAHCLIFPLLAIIIPSFVALGLTSESFHFWMVISVLPTSIYALTIGCKKHKKFSLIIAGALGLSCLILALILGESMLGEWGEKALTLTGAIIIALAHVKNFKLCQQHKNCHCDSSDN